VKELKLYFLWCLVSGPLVVVAGTYAGLPDLATESLLGAAYIIGLYAIYSYFEDNETIDDKNEHNSDRQEGMHKMQQNDTDTTEQRTSDQLCIPRNNRKNKHKRHGSEPDGGDTLSTIYTEQPSSGELQGTKPNDSITDPNDRNTSAPT
jgi:hypothetical protein